MSASTAKMVYSSYIQTASSQARVVVVLVKRRTCKKRPRQRPTFKFMHPSNEPRRTTAGENELNFGTAPALHAAVCHSVDASAIVPCRLVHVGL